MKNLNATDLHGRLTVGGYGQDYLNRLNAVRNRITVATMQQPAAAGGAATKPYVAGSNAPDDPAGFVTRWWPGP